jgi:glyoxylase-like metal-dependent hydrolase (beta-lactamase superfamily II)
MIKIQSFTFNPFQENTYIAYDETNECIIVDPGCYDENENTILKNFIEHNNLKPVALINTHCHLDHIFGNKFVADTYKLNPQMHQLDLPMLEYAPLAANKYGVHLGELPEVGAFLEEGDVIEFGSSKFEIIFTPGHAPGHICLVNKEENITLSADVLFHLSIGRTDLPLGDHETLLNSIRHKLLTLDDAMVVFPGHGPKTSIGFEKANNPFLQ